MPAPKLDERPRRANRDRRTILCPLAGAAALLMLALGACADGGAAGAGQGLAYPDLRDFPERPAAPPLAEREMIGNELLADLERQRYESQELRHRVGLGPAASMPAEPPTMPPLPAIEQAARPDPTRSPIARYLRQQIRWETRGSNLGEFMDRLTTPPLAIDPAFAAESPMDSDEQGTTGPEDATAAAEPRPRPLVPPPGAVPAMPTAPEPLLDRFLAWTGVGGG